MEGRAKTIGGLAPKRFQSGHGKPYTIAVVFPRQRFRGPGQVHEWEAAAHHVRHDEMVAIQKRPIRSGADNAEAEKTENILPRILDSDYATWIRAARGIVILGRHKLEPCRRVLIPKDKFDEGERPFDLALL